MGRQIDHHAAAERTSHQDDLIFQQAGTLRQPRSCRTGIGQHSRFARSACAVAITSIVEGHHRQLMLVAQIEQQFVQIADVLAVSMGIEDHGARLRMVDVPTVQPCAIRGGEVGVFELRSAHRVRPGRRFRRLIDHLLFQMSQRALHLVRYRRTAAR